MIIADLVQVPAVRTVIKLADLADGDLRRSMMESFIVTEEAAFILSGILGRMEKKEPQGFFVIGNYGSGKSHLLNVLSLLLSDGEARQIFREGAARCRQDSSVLLRGAEQTAASPPLVVEISLVEHSNREYLEHIVLSRTEKLLAQRAGKSDLPPGAPASSPLPALRDLPRQEAFRALQETLQQQGYNGLVLLIDELSEFLRSKENARVYNEDIRFLQYLGEFAETIPAWIVATMQENIENTGALSGEMLHKIKDRYPARFRLSGEHVKEIVSRRLVQKKEAAERALPALYEELLRAFGRLPFSRDDFAALYPVHPQTVELLDELRPLFSQHRGVVDFIHYRLSGDERRGIPPFLEQPASHLLTADSIFDHFRDRIRETVETSAYSEEVFQYFQREVADIFPEEEDAHTALRLVKLLILEALAPTRRPFTATELTGLLLHRYTDLESPVNYDYIEEILQNLAAQGAYVVAGEKGDGSGRKTYSIDLQADTALLLKKKQARLISSFHAGDQRILEGLLPWLEDSILPLKQMRENPRQSLEITWQNTRRQGRILFEAREYLTTGRLMEIEEELEKEESDFTFFLARPFFAAEGENQAALSGEKEKNYPASLVCWIPRGITAREESCLQEAFASSLLYQEYTADDSPTGKQVREQLQGMLENQVRAVKELFRDLYFQGTLQTAQKTLEPSSLGYLHFDDLISSTVAEGLKSRFPRHFEICPQSEKVSQSLLQRTLDILASPDAGDETLERGTRALIESTLRPLGVVKKRGQSYTLEFNPRSSAIVAEFLSQVPARGRIPLVELYWKLRKGPFGLPREGFQALGLAAILSGAVSAYQGGRRLAPGQVNYYRFWKIEEIAPGTVVRPELQELLAEIPFLPSRLQVTPLTFSSQQSAWEHICAFKETQEAAMQEIRSEMKRLEGNRYLPGLNHAKIERIMQRFGAFLGEIKVSYASQEGLERFLAAYQSNPLAAEDQVRLEALQRFIKEDLRSFLRLGYYLQDPGLQVPAGEKYASLQRRRGMLLELLREEEIAWDDKLRARIAREFKLFLDEYVSLYLQEHGRFAGPEALEPYRKLTSSRNYRLLERCGQLGELSTEHEIVSINRQLSAILEKECREADEGLLRERPLCTCGFVLGEKRSLPLVAELEARIRQGIRGCLEALRGSEAREKILQYKENLEMVGRRKETEALETLLELPADDPRLAENLDELLNRDAAAHLRRALLGEAVIIERTLEDLHELLAGRVFTARQLQEVISNWIRGEAEQHPDYIRILETKARRQQALFDGRADLSAAAETRGQASPAERNVPRAEKTYHPAVPGDFSLACESNRQAGQSLLEQHFPSLLPLRRSGETELFASALLLGWLELHSAAALEAADSRAGPLPEQLPGILKTAAADAAACSTDLYNLGRMLLQGAELPAACLQEPLRFLQNRFSGSELLELCYRHLAGRIGKAAGDLFDFNRLLEHFVQEPLFPDVTEALFQKIAAQVTAEESRMNIKVLLSSFSWARKELQSNVPNRGSLPGSKELAARKEDLLAHLELLTRCNLSLRTAEAAVQAPPEKDRDWEKLYRQYAPFELQADLLEQVPGSAAAVLPVERWKRCYASALEALEERFKTYLEKDAPENRWTLQSLLQRYSTWAVRQKKAGAYLLVLDGARLDIWNYLLEYAAAETHCRKVKEGFTWAHLPTVTERQLEPLKEAWLLGHIVNMGEGSLLELLSEPAAFFAAVDNRRRKETLPADRQDRLQLKAIKLDYLDDKVHTSSDRLGTFLEEILLQSRRKLWPLLDNAPSGSLLLLVSDHGFKANPYFQRALKGEEPRYYHGGASPSEVLAPWSLLEKP